MQMTSGKSKCRLLTITGGPVPEPWGLQSLQCLRLISCQLKTRPKGIRSLKNLSVLEIRDCNGEC
jgi:hypothetical protein